jgi:hypothetical protein
MQRKRLIVLAVAAAGAAAALTTGGVALADDGTSGTEVVIEHPNPGADGSVGVAREDCPDQGGSGGTEQPDSGGASSEAL